MAGIGYNWQAQLFTSSEEIYIKRGNVQLFLLHDSRHGCQHTAPNWLDHVSFSFSSLALRCHTQRLWCMPPWQSECIRVHVPDVQMKARSKSSKRRRLRNLLKVSRQIFSARCWSWTHFFCVLVGRVATILLPLTCIGIAILNTFCVWVSVLWYFHKYH